MGIRILVEAYENLLLFKGCPHYCGGSCDVAITAVAVMSLRVIKSFARTTIQRSFVTTSLWNRRASLSNMKCSLNPTTTDEAGCPILLRCLRKGGNHDCEHHGLSHDTAVQKVSRPWVAGGPPFPSVTKPGVPHSFAFCAKGWEP